MITRCLFCKKSTQGSKSVEHIIPESIGNKQKVLPIGIVCDACNNYFSIKVENLILSDISLRNIRAFYQVPNKRNRLQSLLGEIGGTGIKVNLKIKGRKMDIQPENEKDRSRVEEHFHSKLTEDNFSPLLFAIDINPPKKEMSRFLAKMALEALAYRFLKNEDLINSLIDDPHYDLIRNYARLGTCFKEWPYHQRRIFPDDTKMRHPKTGKWVQAGFGFEIFLTPRPETYFAFLFYGMEFVINLGGPSIKGYEDWLIENNNISPAIERLGIKLVTKINNNKTEYFLEGSFDASAGKNFDAIRLRRTKT